MFKSLFSTVFGALVAFATAALPADAADDIATKVQICNACHGQSGEPLIPAIPTIWGQQENYLYKELHDYHSGDRANPLMSSLVKAFNLEELRDVAAYFAAKSWPARQSAAAGSPPEGIAMCKACHGQNFEGSAAAPRLAGLGYEYLVADMQSFADGTRTNNRDMPGFMKALTEQQRQEIARYLSAL
jgi:cytochrome c553